MPVRGWLHQASKRLLSRSGKNQVSRQRNGTVKPSGLRLHATPCTHPGPANCITSCSDAKKKLGIPIVADVQLERRILGI